MALMPREGSRVDAATLLAIATLIVEVPRLIREERRVRRLL